MDWQQGVSLSIVALTATLFLYARWRKRKAGSLCGHGCACAISVPRETVTYRARKGERSRIITRLT